MWRSLTLDQTWRATRFTYKYCIAYAWMLFCCLSSNCPLIAYFLKKNYSLRQNIFEKNWGFERGHSHQSQLVFIWIFLKLELDWEQAARRNLKIRWRSDRTLHRTLMSSVRSVHRRWTCYKGVTGCWNSVLSVSGQKELQRPVDHEDIKARWSNSGCVRSVSTRRVRSRFQRIWTSLESTERWVVASGQ